MNTPKQASNVVAIANQSGPALDRPLTPEEENDFQKNLAKELGKLEDHEDKPKEPPLNVPAEPSVMEINQSAANIATNILDAAKSLVSADPSQVLENLDNQISAIKLSKAAKKEKFNQVNALMKEFRARYKSSVADDDGVINMLELAKSAVKVPAKTTARKPKNEARKPSGKADQKSN